MITLRSSDSFVVYRLPGQQHTKLIIERDQCSTAHFRIGDFHQRERYIHADEVYENTSFSYVPDKTLGDHPDVTQEQYMSDARSIIDDIRTTALDKLVYSRTKTKYQKVNDVYTLYVRLCDAYPDAMVYCYHTPSGGCWMGATPELLIRQTDDAQYETMALAGTQHRSKPIEDITWQEKERKEQQFLVQYISEVLNRERVSYTELQTRTLDTGTVYHICTDFEIHSHSADISKIGRWMHPGPAISGYPVPLAIDRLGSYESHDRRDYCGYLGPIGIDEQQALYINLRCMEVYADAYLLYLGGGLTADSDPDSEWHETELKAQTLMKHIDDQNQGI